MIEIKNKKKCCGCKACGDICKKKCISFQIDNEGFWYPKVDLEKCNNCGLCNKICPILSIGDLKKNDLKDSECYAAEHKNLEVVFDSTSGGLFSALAEYMYRNHGYVGGAIFNDDFSVSHFISSNSNDLIKLRSSKYLQSDLEGFYLTIKNLVVKGENVLVCGTPCQMAALRSFLKKDYQNLIIVDFICRGVNSPKIWLKYLKSFEERYGAKVVYVKAKSKEYGWRNLTQKVILEDGQEFFETKNESLFTQGYLQTNAYCRPSCYDCQFKGFPRIADITLADFWGIENYEKQLEKDLGTSLVMVNSIKGREYFTKIEKKLNFIKMPFSSILSGNVALTQSLSAPLVDREKFFNDVDKLSFHQLADKYFYNKSSKKQIKELLKKLKDIARFSKLILKTTRLHPKALFQTIKYSGLSNLLHKKGIIFSTYCSTNISRKATIEINGLMVLGEKEKFPSSKLESRLCIDNGGKLTILGDVHVGYGCDIEIFNGGNLIFHGKKLLRFSGSNIGCTIICANKIEIGPDVVIGRNVTIRDNNGAHYLNRQGYKNARPVNIGEKAWLCESCTIMPGANIGRGAVVGAKAFVIDRVQDHSLVLGYPAKVIDSNVLWKY